MASSPQHAVADPGQGELAPVIPIGPPRSCFTCFNSRAVELDIAGPVTYCSIYSEVVHSEQYAALDCLSYERCNDGDQPDDLPDDLSLEM